VRGAKGGRCTFANATWLALELQEAFDAVYDEAGYDELIDYDQTPPPPRGVQVDTFVREVLRR